MRRGVVWLILICLLCFMIGGCAHTGFARRYDALRREYESGSISYDQYLQRYQILQNEEIRLQQQVQWLLR